MKARWIISVTILTVGSALAYGANTCSFSGLGDFPGGLSASSAGGVSDDGSVVVGYSYRYEYPSHEAFRWEDLNGNGLVDPNEKLDYLDDHPEFCIGCFPNAASISSQANAVSSDGSIVVGYSNTSLGYETFRWTQPTGLVSLGDLPGGAVGSLARGLSPGGLVVVGYGHTDMSEAFRWTEATAMVGLGDFPGDIRKSDAAAVTPDGSVVVGFGHSAFGQEAYRWKDLNDDDLPDEKLDDHPEFGLGDLPGGDFWSAALDVSSNGLVVVGYGTSDLGPQAFRWEDPDGDGLVGPNEKLDYLDDHPEFGLGDLPGGAFLSRALAVTPDGSIVVGYGTSDLGTQAFIWDAENGMRILQDVLESYGLDLAGWTLQNASGISSDGLVLVGQGTNPSGDMEAWRAVVPEPATLTLLAFGGLAVLRRRRMA